MKGENMGKISHSAAIKFLIFGVMVVFFSLFISSNFFGVGIDPGLKARFFSEAPLAWKEYAEFTKGLEGTIDCKVTKNDNIIDRTLSTAIQNKYGKLVSVKALFPSPDKPARPEELYAINPDYSFALRNSIDRKSWALMEMKDNEDKTFRFASNIDTAFKNMGCLVRLHTTPLEAVIREPSFELVGISPILINGKNLVQV